MRKENEQDLNASSREPVSPDYLEAVGCTDCRFSNNLMNGQEIACTNPEIIEKSGVQIFLVSDKKPSQVSVRTKKACTHGERRPPSLRIAKD